MPKYKVVDTDQLDADLTSVADAIRAKGDTSEPFVFPSGFVDAVSVIQGGGKLQSKTVSPSHSEQIIVPDEDYYGLASVTVKPVPKLQLWESDLTAGSEMMESAIPLFGWKDDGWLDMPNEPSMDPTEPVKQFQKWKKAGFHIKKVGHDRKFARPYYTAMKKARFFIVDQPQLSIAKSEGLRYIEHKAKIGCLYYCHAEPFSYCVQNVRGQEKTDDVVVYDKVDPNSRIDVFDASVFATIRMLVDTGKAATAASWYVSNSDTQKGADSNGDI